MLCRWTVRLTTVKTLTKTTLRIESLLLKIH